MVRHRVERIENGGLVCDTNIRGLHRDTDYIKIRVTETGSTTIRVREIGSTGIRIRDRVHYDKG